MSSGKGPQLVRVVLLILTAAVLVSILMAPFTLPGNSVGDLSGQVGAVDHGEALKHMNPFASATYLAGDVLCDQLSAHSYYLNGNQMPVSARWAGLFFGLMWGALAAVAVQPRTRSRVLLGVVPMLVDWGLQFVSDYTSTNPLRLMTGVLAGIVIALFVANALSRPLELERSSGPPRPEKKG